MRAATLALVLLVGCGSPHREYVEADRDTFNAVEPILLDAAEDDARHELERQAIRRKVASWRARINRALAETEPSK